MISKHIVKIMIGILLSVNAEAFLLKNFSSNKTWIKAKTFAGRTANQTHLNDGTNSIYNTPTKIASDGTYLYVYDSKNYVIRRIEKTTQTVDTIAGTGLTSGASIGSIGTQVRLSAVTALAYSNNNLYFIDGGILKVMSTNTLGFPISQLAITGAALSTNANAIIVADTINPILYVANSFSNNILKLSISGNSASSVVLAGSTSGQSGVTEGIGTAAFFFNPSGLALGPNYLYVSERGYPKIRKIDLSTLQTSLVAGSITPGFVEGAGTNARFGITLSEMLIDADGNLLVLDVTNSRIRKIVSPSSTPTVSSFAGNGTVNVGNNSIVGFGNLSGLAQDSDGIYFCDSINNQIKRISSSGIVNALSGISWNNNDDANSARFNFAQANHIALGAMVSDGATPPNYYVTDYTNGLIKKITYIDKVVQISTIAGNGILSSVTPANVGTDASLGHITGMAYYNGYLYVASTFSSNGSNGTGSILAININNPSYPVSKPLEIGRPTGNTPLKGITSDKSGIFYLTIANMIYKWVPSFDTNELPTSGTYTFLAGATGGGNTNGAGTSATFSIPMGIIYDSGNLYVSESNDIRIVPINGDATTTLIGSNAAGSSNSTSVPTFNNPRGLAIRKGYLYVADYFNNRIRKIALNGTKIVTTVVGNTIADPKFPFDKPDALGTSATITNPSLMFYDDYRDILFTNDQISLKYLTP